jgi:hypothetical protein
VKTQFDKLVLSADHKTITASGAITWSQGDQHCRCTITLSQNNGAISGSATTSNYNPGDPTWEGDVQVSTPHNGQWDPNQDVLCHGVTDPPSNWPDQTLPLQVGATA